jgi:hypothetical protein
MELAGSGREYDAVKRKLAWLAAHPGQSIRLDDATVAPQWRAFGADGGEVAASNDLGGLMNQLERLERDGKLEGGVIR